MPEDSPSTIAGPELKPCPVCGTELPPAISGEKVSRHCPQCLLNLGFLDVPAVRPSETEFGEYKLIRQVGRGAMGVVYEALQVSLQRKVALKMIIDADFAEPALRRRFRIEAEAAAKLCHPNIVPVYDFGDHDGQPFLSMELIEGATLKEKIRRGELCLANSQVDPRTIAQFTAAVARAVAHAHENGILHRDLKPANILVDATGQPHLTDFGLAKILEEHPLVQGSATVSGGLLGTPAYMAPEMAAGGRSSAASDIYSLGAILYEMLTGQPPFKASSAVETLRLVSHSAPRNPRALVRRVPRDLETICLKCLERDPGPRYDSAEALAEDLERWLEDKPIRARPAGPVLRLGRWCRRNPVGAALILVLCSGLAVSLALLNAVEEQKRATLEQKQAVQVLLDMLTAKYYAEMEQLWQDPTHEFVQFTNVYLQALVGNKPAPPGSLPLTFATEIAGDPLQQAHVFSPVLRFIESRMEEQLGRPVAFNLRLQKHRPDVGTPSINGEVDFQRLGPVAYIRAAESAPGLQLLVAERGSKDGVIFASKSLGITNLAAIRGLRVALAHTNSIVSFEAERQMFRLGLKRSELGAVAHLNPRRTAPSADSKGQADDDWSESQYAHDVVIHAVLSGEFDVGDARWQHFAQNRNRGRGLVELARFPVPERVYVARPGLEPAIANAFRQSLLSLHKPEEIAALRRLFNSQDVGFVPVAEQEMNEIRHALTNDIPAFESN